MSRLLNTAMIVPVVVLVMVIFSSGCAAAVDRLACGGPVTVEADYTLTNEQPVAKLETPDASKDCHAEMSLMYYYKDQRLAETEIMPPIIYEFGTTYGVFPNPVSKPVPGPGNNPGDDPVNLWFAETSQGAKNTFGDWTRYHIIAAMSPKVTELPEKGVSVHMSISYIPAKTG